MKIKQTFAPGMYEVIYGFTALNFDKEKLYFDLEGRRTGPWDYAPWGAANSGDCLLPCVHLTSSQNDDVKARVFIPRQSELDRCFFNGRVGFRVRENKEIELEIAADTEVLWHDVKIEEVKNFADLSLKISDFTAPGRFFINDENLEILRQNYRRTSWGKRVSEVLDDCAPFAPPVSWEEARVVVTGFLKGKTKHVYEDNVVFWGDYLMALSLRTLLFDQPGDYEQLVKWTDALVNLHVWGGDADPKGRDHNNDLTADFNMMGLAIALSFHGKRFGAERCCQIRQKIDYQAGEMLKWIIGCRSSWPGVTTQNHAYYGYQTLIVAGLSLLPDAGFHTQALDYLQIGVAAYKRFVANLPSDGSYHEGVGYVSFGLLGLCPSLFLLEASTGKPWMVRDWLAKHVEAMNCLMPNNPGKGLFFDDATAVFPIFPAIVMWAHNPANVPDCQHTVNQLLAKYRKYQQGHNGGVNWLCHNFWIMLFAPQFTDDTLDSLKLETEKNRFSLLPSAGYFVGNLDSNSKLYFLTAPPHGHEQFRREFHTYGYGHHHPDTGNVLLIDDGKWILSDTGYTLCKAGIEHNILLIDGKGQYNDNYPWMPPPPWDIEPEKVKVIDSGYDINAKLNLQYIYPKEYGLKLWRRSVTLINKSVIIEDTVECAGKHEIAILWGSDYQWVTEGDNGAVNTGNWHVTFFGSPRKLAVEQIKPYRKYSNYAVPYLQSLQVKSPGAVNRFKLISVFQKNADPLAPGKLLELCGVGE